MRRAKIYNHGVYAGDLIETDKQTFEFHYLPDYKGPAISLTMPCLQKDFYFENFPPFFDGLLPEGLLLEFLLKNAKIDRGDYFSQLITVGKDCVGSVTVEAAT